MQHFDRGDTLEFVVDFTAEDGSPTEPTAAQIAITYPMGSTRERTVYSLVKGGDNLWRYTWDSSVALAAGRVNYSIKATGALRDVEDGSFLLDTNDANVVA